MPWKFIGKRHSGKNVGTQPALRKIYNNPNMKIWNKTRTLQRSIITQINMALHTYLLLNRTIKTVVLTIALCKAHTTPGNWRCPTSISVIAQPPLNFRARFFGTPCCLKASAASETLGQKKNCTPTLMLHGSKMIFSKNTLHLRSK